MTLRAAAWWRSAEASRIITPRQYAARLLPLLKPLGLRILIEPGRFISGNAGILVTRVEYVKRTGKKNFLIVDAAMNDLIRPALYEAYHEIVPVNRNRRARVRSDVVGPVCESGDSFCQDRLLPHAAPGDLLALMSAGDIRQFAFTLLIGIVIGTSSSIFIAAPILLLLGEGRIRPHAAPAEAAPANVRGTTYHPAGR